MATNIRGFMFVNDELVYMQLTTRQLVNTHAEIYTPHTHTHFYSCDFYDHQ